MKSKIEKIRADGSPLCEPSAFWLFFGGCDAFARAEEQGNAPDAGKCHDGVNDAAQQRTASSADPRHDVELKQTDAPPVECTDDG